MKKKDSVGLDWPGKNKSIELNKFKQIEEMQIVYPYTYKDDSVPAGEILPLANSPTHGRLIKGLNLEVMQNLLNTGYREKFDLIYLDPPYFSASNYQSKLKVGSKDNLQIINRQVFMDSWKSLDEYLDYIFSIVQLSKELLSNQGSLFVHLDWHACHYVKILLDEVFSRDNLINEIIWCYGGGSNTKRHFQKKHDTIFWYAKSSEYIFNPQYRPYTEKTKERGLTKVKGPKYVLNEQGALMQDWWTDINKILSPTAYENLKFPTQKPLALLERIINTASNQDSLVGDFFIGSGTMAEAAEMLNRNWIGCDNSPIAIQTTHYRLLNYNAKAYQIEWLDPPDYESLNIEVIFKLDNDSLIISLKGAGELLNSVIAFWEVGIYEKDIFTSLLQVVRPYSNFPELPDQVVIKDITNTLKNIAVKVYDFRGNTLMKKQPL